MDLADLSLSKLRQLIVDAQKEIESRETVTAARDAVEEAVQAYAAAASVTVLEAWRELVPEGVEVPDDPEPPTAPEFVPPTGAHDVYNKGDLVTYRGKVYRSRIDNNAYSPAAYPQGWEEYR